MERVEEADGAAEEEQEPWKSGEMGWYEEMKRQRVYRGWTQEGG